MKKKIILDCDAAYEDLIAQTLLLLNTEVKAITVAFGESDTPIGAANVERVCRMLCPDQLIPVAYGRNTALDEHGHPFPPFIHTQANNVLLGTDVPPLAYSLVEDDAVGLLYRILMESEEKITIVATGALTNIAQLIVAHPECRQKIEKLFIMGGALMVPGNISDLIPDTDNDLAEWNIYADPVAADIVFSSSGFPIVLVPLDITKQMPLTPSFMARLASETGLGFKLTFDMLMALKNEIGDAIFYGQLQFWDSLSAMLSLDDSLAEMDELTITVDVDTGQTIASTEPVEGRPCILAAMRLVNPEATYERFFTFMSTLSIPERTLAIVDGSGNYFQEHGFFSKPSPSTSSGNSFTLR